MRLPRWLTCHSTHAALLWRCWCCLPCHPGLALSALFSLTSTHTTDATATTQQTQRRMESDRFFTQDYTEEVYTPEGIAWVEGTTMSDILT